jgi:prenylcysteine oxidase/farnesylcysteine lyase
LLKLINRYKLSVPKLLLILREAKKKIKNLYLEKRKKLELWELFEGTGLDKWYKKPFDQILIEKGVDKNFIDEIITPITRIIYSQNAELGGFAGLSSLLGVYGESTYSLKEGNNILPRSLLEVSGSKVKLGEKVNIIEKTSKGSFRVFFGDDSSVFDAVIIAAPLEVAKITFERVINQKWQEREYQKIYIKLMKGVVNSSYFNLDKTIKLPSVVLTSKEADPITRFSINKSAKDESWVTVTSKEPIDSNFLDNIFKNGKFIVDHTWKAAYPVFKPTDKLQSSHIDKGLVYLNSIETAASCLETSALAASYAIKMINEDLK